MDALSHKFFLGQKKQKSCNYHCATKSRISWLNDRLETIFVMIVYVTWTRVRETGASPSVGPFQT